MWQNCCWGLRARKSNFGCAGRGGRLVRVLLKPEVKTRWDKQKHTHDFSQVALVLASAQFC
jgi:hypothetical protein